MIEKIDWTQTSFSKDQILYSFRLGFGWGVVFTLAVGVTVAWIIRLAT